MGDWANVEEEDREREDAVNWLRYAKWWLESDHMICGEELPEAQIDVVLRLRRAVERDEVAPAVALTEARLVFSEHGELEHVERFASSLLEARERWATTSRRK